jgi:hypothetical protein
MTNYYYSRVRILSFSVILLILSLGFGTHIFLHKTNLWDLFFSLFLISTGVFLIVVYRRIITAVFKRKPALSISADNIQHFGTRKFSWSEVEYYRLKRGLIKSSIEIKLYDHSDQPAPLRKSIRSYFDKLPLLSFNKNILIVDLTFIIGVDEYIVQTFEKYDLIGQETERMAS